MFSFVETVRSFKWHLIAVEAASFIAFAGFRIYSIDTEPYSYSNLLSFAFGFIASLAFFTLYYLNLFGNPASNGNVYRILLQIWFWIGAAFSAVFWALVFFHFVYTAAVGF